MVEWPTDRDFGLESKVSVYGFIFCVNVRSNYSIIC